MASENTCQSLEPDLTAYHQGELSPELMDSVSLSGARFLSFLSRLEKS